MNTLPDQANSSTNSSSQPNAWDRWARVWSTVFYISLLAPAALALQSGSGLTAPQRLWVVLLTGSLTVWYVIMAFVYPRLRPDWYDHPWITSLFLLVGIALWVALARIDPVFGFALGGLYSQIFIRLPAPWAVPVSLILAVLSFFALNFDKSFRLSSNEPIALIYLSSIGFALLFYAWIVAIIKQSAQRKALIDKLQRTHASLVSAEREAGVLGERQRLAREIHDTLAQGFASIVMQLEAAEQALPKDAEVSQRHIDLARRTARDSLEQARRAVQDLRPEALDEATLPDAVERTVHQWASSTGIAADVACTGVSRPLHPDIEATLLRAVQEALANIRKHTDASRVTVTLSYIEDVVVLDVQDNGVGPSPSPAASALSGGFGLQAMRERVEQFHGSLLLESVPGEGTTLVVAIPVAQTPAEETGDIHW